VSGIFDAASASVLVADYAGVDGGGKINAIGLGVQLTQLLPLTNTTGAMFVVAFIDIPRKFSGQKAVIGLELRNLTDGNSIVKVQGPTGQLEGLQVVQEIEVSQPQSPGLHLPDDAYARVQLSMGFPTGLPLEPLKTYAWKLNIDGQSRQSWRAIFSLVGQPPGPVFGGFSGPADIPNIAPMDTPEPEG
jgi:hypothetical protein